jgi:hypothetical protein
MGASNRPAVKERHCCSTMCKNPTNCLAPSQKHRDGPRSRVQSSRCMSPTCFLYRWDPASSTKSPIPSAPTRTAPRRLRTASRRHKNPYPSHIDRGGRLPRTRRNLPCWTRRRTPVCCVRLEPGRIQPVRTSLVNCPREGTYSQFRRAMSSTNIRAGPHCGFLFSPGSDLHAHQT